MSVLLSLFGIMFIGSFAIDYRRGKTLQQSAIGGIRSIQNNMWIFFRTSLSMMIIIGPLLLISGFVFSDLVSFNTIPAFIIAVLSI
ncbi:MAG: hypothetical protein ACOVQN_01830, partial [Exiguobacterium sp.]